MAGLSLTAVREFSTEISKRLADWGYPDAESVRYDRNEQDIITGDQQRSAHGQGVRAILHAARTRRTRLPWLPGFVDGLLRG